jgi:hypothetical protein
MYGHTLDLFITRVADNFIDDVSTGSFSIDHASVFFPLFALVYHLALLSV